MSKFLNVKIKAGMSKFLNVKIKTGVKFTNAFFFDFTFEFQHEA